MAEQVTTKVQVKRRYVHVTWVVSGSLFAAGLGLSLSLMFLGPGILIMMLAAVAAVVGMGTVALLPRLMTFVPHTCPFCHQENLRLVSTSGYWCDSCGNYVNPGQDYGRVEVRD
ncbi:MAG: hypothetical protein AAB270_04105 [Chloroflexota bacterium]